ncbi:hypothetical protein [Salmonella enterica]|uniref:hypothetical protein n=1 Tax=Salmonella enterica TaxID=28901 RepID=UPI0009AC39F9|nr:hypothetical protein [Salmonella enterica]
MTTITRERLKQIYAECEERDPAIFEIRELVRIALASLDAETVRYLNKFSGTCVTLEQQPNAADDVAVYIPLYVAPPVPVVPDGYALVPVEPTDEMIAAAMNCEDVLFNSDESFCVQFGNIYEAMLAAAPKPEQR